MVDTSGFELKISLTAITDLIAKGFEDSEVPISVSVDGGYHFIESPDWTILLRFQDQSIQLISNTFAFLGVAATIDIQIPHLMGDGPRLCMVDGYDLREAIAINESVLTCHLKFTRLGVHEIRLKGDSYLSQPVTIVVYPASIRLASIHPRTLINR